MTNLRFTTFFLLALVCFSNDFEPSEQNRQASMKRTACYVLIRYHIMVKQKEIGQIMQNLLPSIQQQYLQKIYAVAVQTCEAQISKDQVQEFFIEQEGFDPSHMYYLLDSMDYAEIVNDLELTRDQQRIIAFIELFDEQMAQSEQQQQGRQQQDEQNDL